MRCDGPGSDRPEVIIDTGPLIGAGTDGVATFKGIPYAAAPLGDLRWREPQLAAPWTEPRRATGFGPDCSQVDRDTGLPAADSSEDCLFLNLWGPHLPPTQSTRFRSGSTAAASSSTGRRRRGSTGHPSRGTASSSSDGPGLARWSPIRETPDGAMYFRDTGEAPQVESWHTDALDLIGSVRPGNE